MEFLALAAFINIVVPTTFMLVSELKTAFCEE